VSCEFCVTGGRSLARVFDARTWRRNLANRKARLMAGFFRTLFLTVSRLAGWLGARRIVGLGVTEVLNLFCREEMGEGAKSVQSGRMQSSASSSRNSGRRYFANDFT